MNFELMLAKTYDPKRVQSWQTLSIEPKLDGVRVVAIARYDEVKFYSRNGRELGMFGHLVPQLAMLKTRMKRITEEMDDGVVFDGEMVGVTFGDVAGAIHRKNATVHSTRFHLFCAMPLSSFKKGQDTLAQRERLALLHRAHTVAMSGLTISVAALVEDHQMVQAGYKIFRKKGHEGAMVKDLSQPWQAGRSYAWMKIKDEKSVDVRVTGMKEGKGKYRGMCGALYVEHKGKQVRVSGMDDAQRELFWNRPKSVVGRMVEVVYQEETVHGSLRHPRFKCLRPDKE